MVIRNHLSLEWRFALAVELASVVLAVPLVGQAEHIVAPMAPAALVAASVAHLVAAENRALVRVAHLEVYLVMDSLQVQVLDLRLVPVAVALLVW